MSTDQPSRSPSREPVRTVFIIDDDEAVRDALMMLVRSVGLDAESFASAADFLAVHGPRDAGCLVLDVRMPGMSGLELQEELARSGSTLPIIFITGHAHVAMAVRAIQAGAFDFIEKPFDDQQLLDKIHLALDAEHRARRDLEVSEEIQQRIASLTPREREVLDLVVKGAANKVTANRLGLSQRTVEIHRANVMRKMGADSLAHLVRLMLRAGGDSDRGSSTTAR